MKYLLAIRTPGQILGTVFFGRDEGAILGVRKNTTFTHDSDGLIPNTREVSFLLVETHNIQPVLKQVSEENPGCDVEAYTLSNVGYCPAGEFVLKAVSDNGILPD